MSLQRNFRVGGVSTTAVVLLFALAPLSMCRIAAAQEGEPEPTETIEEIVVYGKKSLVRLRLEMYKAEDVAFEVFNSLNSDDKFDIHCRKEAPIGSHILRRVCRPNYVGELTGVATRQSLLTGDLYLHPAAKIKQMDELLRKEMEALVVKRPELLNALSEYSDAKQVLDSEHKRRCEGRIFICRK